MNTYNEHCCLYSGFPDGSSPTGTISILKKYLNFDARGALDIVRKLKLNERVHFEFNNREAMLSFVQEMEKQGLVAMYVSEELIFDEKIVREEFEEVLRKAVEFEVELYPDGQFGCITTLATNGYLLIEREDIAQFIAKELVARGAKVVRTPRR